MFMACSFTKLFISTGMASIVIQLIVGVLVYGIILIVLRDENLYMVLRKIRAKMDSRG